MSGINNSAYEYTQQEIDSGKTMAIIAYIIALIPLFAVKDNRYVRFHTNQGLIVLILAVIYAVLSNIVFSIFGWGLIWTLVNIFGILVSVLAILGIINAASGKAKELPVIGNIQILK